MRVKAAKVEPIKKRNDVKRIAGHIHNSYRNGPMLCLMFLIGCNTGLRASDIRRLTYSNLTSDSFKITEKKTNKIRTVIINKHLKTAINDYLEGKPYEITKRISGKQIKAVISAKVFIVNPEANVFTGTQHELIGVKYMHKIIKNACRKLRIKGNYGSHTMRNTFAYHAYKRCNDINKIKGLLNHSSSNMTKVYLNGLDIENTSKDTTMSDEDICNINLG